MKRFTILSAVVIGCCVVPLLAFGQGGGNRELLTRAIRALAQGQCPTAIMSVVLGQSCQQFLPQMNNRLLQLGSLKQVSFKGIDQTPGGPVEVYLAQHENGQMLWTMVTYSGKITGLWTPG